MGGTVLAMLVCVQAVTVEPGIGGSWRAEKAADAAA